MKFKEGDIAIALRYQPGRTGPIKRFDKKWNDHEWKWIIDDGDANQENMPYAEKDIRLLTPLEKAMK